MARSSTSWTPGTTANPKGRAPRNQETRYLEIFRESVSEADWRKIIAKAVKQAITGDKYARDFLASYLLPKPVQPLQISPADTALLAEVIDTIVRAGLTPGDVFGRMIAVGRAQAELDAKDDGTDAS